MTFAQLILRNLQFHARSHMGVFLGATVGSAILIGALAIGDSVRESLRQMALSRIGRVESALTTGDRFVRDKLGNELGADGAAVLQLTGNVTAIESSTRANKVQILGVTDAFWRLAIRKPSISLNDETVALNSQLADHLKLKVGDSVLVRVQKPSLLSREMPITPQEDTSVTLRMSVGAIVSDDEFGRFSLNANQTPPLNVFVDLRLLQAKTELPGKANLLLATSHVDHASNALHRSWSLEDAELKLQTLPDKTMELSSPRIFLDQSIVRNAEDLNSAGKPILTYFVNELRNGDHTTPYSMVTAAAAPYVPADMQDDQIVLTSWLAEDLKLKMGDEIAIRYFVLGESQRLEEHTNRFRVHSIVPLEGRYADRTLMPDFPGIAKAERTDNWDAGFPIDFKSIRPKDEKYWHDFRGTPKAYVTIGAGKRMWANRFGELTAIRFESAGNMPSARLIEKVSPTSLGISFYPARQQALASAKGSQDFGQLFLGFSFFLITAALILIGLLFHFALEQRVLETGTLLALGFRAKQIRRILLLEGAVVALAGGIIGSFVGVFYARAMLHGLTTIWRDAVGTSSLMFAVTPMTMLIGLFASVVISTITIFIVLRKQAKRTARELLSGVTELVSTKQGCWPVAEWVTAVSGVSAVGLLIWAVAAKRMADAESFFSAGSLLLIAAIAAIAWSLKRLLRSEAGAALTLTALGLRGATRRRKRSVATVALLASGAFLIAAVSAFHLESGREEAKQTSGTGGFALIGETAFPVVQNLSEKAGREFFGLDDKALQDVSFVSVRVREGDDASCLNLNQVHQPRLLGVRAGLLLNRFSFTDGVTTWSSLTNALQNGDVPAIGDAASIQWALHKKVGDAIEYTDEHGNKFKVRIVASLANSIFQGSLIIDEREFIRRFPNQSGYRMFLIDAPSNSTRGLSQTLSRAFRDVGLELTPASDRLTQFNAVQNTYLSTFQVLGGLGLLLGTVGLGVVVLRNVLERRGELALLSALGFRKAALRWLVLSEHAALLFAGLSVGIVAAVAAILPNLLSADRGVPMSSLSLILISIFIAGLLCTFLATRFALRGKLLKSLRNE